MLLSEKGAQLFTFLVFVYCVILQQDQMILQFSSVFIRKRLMSQRSAHLSAGQLTIYFLTYFSLDLPLSICRPYPENFF